MPNPIIDVPRIYSSIRRQKESTLLKRDEYIQNLKVKGHQWSIFPASKPLNHMVSFIVILPYVSINCGAQPHQNFPNILFHHHYLNLDNHHISQQKRCPVLFDKLSCCWACHNFVFTQFVVSIDFHKSFLLLVNISTLSTSIMR